MSYIRAEEVLPKELIETIQQYVNGKAIYIPGTSKKEWGSHTDTRQYLIQRNHEIRVDTTQWISRKCIQFNDNNIIIDFMEKEVSK